MSIDLELREYLDRHGRLRSHFTDDDVSVEQDLDDSAALMAVAIGIVGLRADLQHKGVSERNLKHVEDRLVRRAGRELTEKIWENPRRRLASHPVLSNKFAYGGLWSPAASQFITAGLDYKNQLILEHVVPAKTIVNILAAHASAGGDYLGGARILAELFTHVVLTRPDDSPLTRNLTPGNETKLVDHYAGSNLLNPEELFDTRWSRYIVAADAGVLPFSLDSLGPLSVLLSPA